jgi:hypothetical protein
MSRRPEVVDASASMTTSSDPAAVARGIAIRVGQHERVAAS